jgi:aspartate-semialdehyde dehydrogenase
MVTFHSAFAVEAAAVDAGAASPVANPARQHTGVGLPDLSGLGMSCSETGMNIALGHDGEEERIITETRRILRQPRLRIGMTCIRVPMQRNHTVVISVRFDEFVSPERVRWQTKSAVGLRVVDDVEESCVPRLSEAEGIDEVRVARIRTDSGDPSGRSIAMLVWGDQLPNRAACKAVQIAEALVALRRSERLLL